MSQNPKEIAEKILNCKTYNTTEMQNLARAYLELEKKLQVTNNNWPHEKKLHDEITKLKKSRDGLRNKLTEFADFENPNDPKRVCWPASDYMKKSREAIKADDELMKEGGE